MSETENKQPDNSGEWAMIFRRAIASDERTMYAIAKQAGIPQSMLLRFMAGKSIGLATAEKLGRVLGLELTAAKKTGIPKTSRKLDS
jgi:predicted transcriptional regulator